MIKCAVFDLDGTLLDTITTITYYVNLALKREGLREISEDECKLFVGNGVKKLIERTMASRGAEGEELFSRLFGYYSEKYDAEPLYLTKPYEGIVELISALREKGIRLAVLSNKQHAATADIIPAFFGDSFAVVRGGMDGVPLKPAPDAVFEICKSLGVSQGEIMYVGDTGVDMKTGKAAGAAVTVGVSWGFRAKSELTESGADVIVDKPSEILNYIA